MKLLLTGVSGLLGINFAQEMMQEHEIIGVDRGKLVSAPFKILKQDLLDAGSVEKILDAAQPDWIVNCAALADLDACENNPDLAKRLNMDLPRQLARACKTRSIPLVHISTDAVFDGEKDGFYTEDDKPNPLSVYAKTKLDGESISTAGAWAANAALPNSSITT
jgi:dTDP-4-dehydrorhamnose reductase